MRDINIFETDLFPYLEGEELLDKTLTLTIRDIKPEKLRNSAGKEEVKQVLYFAETQKGFVLNKTNAKRIATLYGKMTGDWAGKQITLYTEPVQAFGETHNALRVASAIPGEESRNEVYWQEYNPTKIQFFQRANDAGFEPAKAAQILKAAGFTNGYDPALAVQMWDALMKTQSVQVTEPMPQARAVEAARTAMDEVEADAAQPVAGDLTGELADMMAEEEEEDAQDVTPSASGLALPDTDGAANLT